MKFPNVVSDYGRWYNLCVENIEYALRQRMYKEIHTKMVEDFKKEIEPMIEEMLKSIVITEVQSERNFKIMRDEFAIKVHINKIEELNK